MRLRYESGWGGDLREQQRGGAMCKHEYKHEYKPKIQTSIRAGHQVDDGRRGRREGGERGRESVYVSMWRRAV